MMTSDILGLVSKIKQCRLLLLKAYKLDIHSKYKYELDNNYHLLIQSEYLYKNNNQIDCCIEYPKIDRLYMSIDNNIQSILGDLHLNYSNYYNKTYSIDKHFNPNPNILLNLVDKYIKQEEDFLDNNYISNYIIPNSPYTSIQPKEYMPSINLIRLPITVNNNGIYTIYYMHKGELSTTTTKDSSIIPNEIINVHFESLINYRKFKEYDIYTDVTDNINNVISYTNNIDIISYISNIFLKRFNSNPRAISPIVFQEYTNFQKQAEDIYKLYNLNYPIKTIYDIKSQEIDSISQYDTIEPKCVNFKIILKLNHDNSTNKINYYNNTGKTLYVLNSLNIPECILPQAYNYNLLHNDLNNKQGLVIEHSFSINLNNQKEVYNIINYLKQNKNKLPSNISQLLKLLYSKLDNSNSIIENYYTFSIICFIEQDVLTNELLLYKVLKDTLTNTIITDKLNYNFDNVNKWIPDNNNNGYTLNIQIISNENKIYYINIGNKKYKIPVIQPDDNNSPSIRITTTIGGNSNTEIFDLEDLEKLGIYDNDYKSRKEDLMLEKMKLDIEASEQNIKHNDEKIALQKEDMKTNKQQAENQYYFANKKLEFEMMKFRLEHKIKSEANRWNNIGGMFIKTLPYISSLVVFVYNIMTNVNDDNTKKK